MLKGRIIEYMDRMAVHSTIDLSNNVLCGKIPDKLTEIIHLGVLNLSWNKLTGNIHNNIGSLKDLESLYLSHNRLSGSIPPSMDSMTFLSNFVEIRYQLIAHHHCLEIENKEENMKKMMTKLKGCGYMEA